jgi:hypothetical protein
MEKHYKIRKQTFFFPSFFFFSFSTDICRNHATDSSAYKICYITEPQQWHLSSLFDLLIYEINES